jgi:hypothetical protein
MIRTDLGPAPGEGLSANAIALPLQCRLVRAEFVVSSSSKAAPMSAIVHALSSTDADQAEWRLRCDMAAGVGPRGAGLRELTGRI